MRILGIESSSLVASVAIVTDGILTAEYTVNLKKTHSQTLLPMIDTVIRMLEIGLDTIDAIAISAGPGSFTGLRIGSATGKGLGLALKKPLIHIPTVDAMAYNLYGANGLICPIMDARRNQVYTGLYHFLDCFEIVKEQCALEIKELAEEINARGEKVIFLGDGVPAYRDMLEEMITVPIEFAPAHVNRQRGGAVAALGAVYYENGKTETAMEHKPDYLRKSQAEREREIAERQGELARLAAGEMIVEKQALPHSVIRAMEKEDLDAVAELEKACFTVPWSRDQISECLNHSYDQVWILEAGGKIAGYCNFRVIAGEGELMRIAVAPSFRGRGYSRELMEILAQDARKKQVKAVTLEVRASNLPAINLYKSCGFETEAVRKDYYQLPPEDAVIMWNRQV